jgi:branched-chain amino acid transport system substrate-binding protein
MPAMASLMSFFSSTGSTYSVLMMSNTAAELLQLLQRQRGQRPVTARHSLQLHGGERAGDGAHGQGMPANFSLEPMYDGVFMLFGSIEGGPSAAVAKVAEARRLPFVGPMAGAPTLRRPHLAMVFPVRAEHREEFRALVGWARRTGLSTVAFFHSDSEVGRAHLDNTRLACEEAGARLLYGLPVKGDVDDAALQAMVRRLQAEPVDCLFNHGSASPYGRLIKAARAAGVRTAFMGVNSGSTELARALGEAGRGMVFSQVMPSPWQRRTALVRDYQQAFGALHPGRGYSYASLEGFATARALVAGLQKAGPRLTRAGLLQALETMDLDLGGVPLRWRPGDHAGAHYVDLAMVARDGRFVQ